MLYPVERREPFLSTKPFRTLIKFLVIGAFGYAIWLYWQRTPAADRLDGLMLGLQFTVVLAAIVGGLWLVDRFFGSRREP